MEVKKLSKFDKYIGQKHNSLLITKVWKDTERNLIMCDCLCDCGNLHTTYLHNVRYGNIGSCGCKRGVRHGKQNTRIYRIWQAMKTRCFNPNAQNYKYYGGKGVSVCDEWAKDFKTFYEWAINNGYTDELTIDRIDINGNYSPTNCRWATMKEQCNKHKSDIYQINLHGEYYSLRDFVDIIGESYSKILTRLHRGKCSIQSLEDEYNSEGLYLTEYQKRAMTTCMDSCDNISYMLLNLVGEVGEFSSKLAKQIRKGNITIGGRYFPNTLQCHCPDDSMSELNTELMYEAGDILWQLSGLCSVMGWKLEDIAQMNLDKLAARKAIGTIDGNGDGIVRGK